MLYPITNVRCRYIRPQILRLYPENHYFRCCQCLPVNIVSIIIVHVIPRKQKHCASSLVSFMEAAILKYNVCV